MRTAAVLPVKTLALAKQRLGATVADPLRRALAEAMAFDVMLALARAEAVEQTIVVTAERAIAEHARGVGAVVIADRMQEGQSQAAALGIEAAQTAGMERVLCVPGDCPALDPLELDALLAREPGAGADVVVVPDRHGTGTNGLLLTPPGAIAPGFGPGSCERHRRLAAAAGATCSVQRLPSLLLDVDTGADLAALREVLAGPGARARRTRAVLGGEPVSAAAPA
jgi:2-phospho-L-lactate guanylyltransferase